MNRSIEILQNHQQHIGIIVAAIPSFYKVLLV